MQTFEIRTYRQGSTYAKPHFFILNKGLNSGRPLTVPCPNCFVVLTRNKADRDILFHLAMMLQVGQVFAFYLKGSVIPFITITDCKKIILSQWNNTESDLAKAIKAIQVITQREEALEQTLKKLKALKQAFIRSSLKRETP